MVRLGLVVLGVWLVGCGGNVTTDGPGLDAGTGGAAGFETGGAGGAESGGFSGIGAGGSGGCTVGLDAVGCATTYDGARQQPCGDSVDGPRIWTCGSLRMWSFGHDGGMVCAYDATGALVGGVNSTPFHGNCSNLYAGVPIPSCPTATVVNFCDPRPKDASAD